MNGTSGGAAGAAAHPGRPPRRWQGTSVPSACPGVGADADGTGESIPPSSLPWRLHRTGRLAPQRWRRAV